MSDFFHNGEISNLHRLKSGMLKGWKENWRAFPKNAP
jgi:hypothetical protein